MNFLNPPSPKRPPFLRLPIELRRQIYAYILPSTTSFDVRLQRGEGEPSKSEYNLTLVRIASGEEVWKMQRTAPRAEKEVGNDIVWRRGSIGLLSTNRQIHEECVDFIYGENTFVVDVAFNSINFRFRWLLPSLLTPSRAYSFLDHFSQRNLMRIKNYIINVEHVDSYTGMIKYNVQGRGLTAGIRRQVQNLVDLLALVPNIHRLRIHLIDGAVSRERFSSGRVHRVMDEKNYATAQTVLDSFSRLYGVRRALITGVSQEYAENLERQMTGSRESKG